MEERIELEEELLDEQGIHLITEEEVNELSQGDLQPIVTETEAETIREFEEYVERDKQVCRHPGCETKLNFYSWRKGYQVCSRCFELRDGVGFCNQKDHDLWEHGVTEKGQCARCAEEQGEWGTMRRKELMKGEPRRRGRGKFYALPGLKREMEATGISMTELARRVGVSATSIRRYRSGDQYAPKLTIEAIARVLKVKVKQLKEG